MITTVRRLAICGANIKIRSTPKSDVINKTAGALDLYLWYNTVTIRNPRGFKIEWEQFAFRNGV